MRASTKRNAVRWLHIGVGSAIAAYIYSPLGQIPSFQLATKAVIIPLTILSGVWLWKGHLLRKKTPNTSSINIFLIGLISVAIISLTSFKGFENRTLTLKINNVEKSGKIYVSFCTESSEWSANGKYHFQFDNPKKGTNTFTITTIPHGTYAIAIYQDLNSNKKLDENMFGAPKEPFAFSNNIVPRFSAPKFEDCKFDFSKDGQIISINLLH
ncbi:MAG: DUF2141 domain-containing protein [Cyclobacteriaceae bacterium]